MQNICLGKVFNNFGIHLVVEVSPSSFPECTKMDDIVKFISLLPCHHSYVCFIYY